MYCAVFWGFYYPNGKTTERVPSIMHLFDDYSTAKDYSRQFNTSYFDLVVQLSNLIMKQAASFVFQKALYTEVGSRIRYCINATYLTILILFVRTSHSLISHMEELFKYVRGAEEEEEKQQKIQGSNEIMNDIINEIRSQI